MSTRRGANSRWRAVHVAKHEGTSSLGVQILPSLMLLFIACGTNTRMADAGADAAGASDSGSGTGDAATGDAATGDAATGDAASGDTATSDADTGDEDTGDAGPLPDFVPQPGYFADLPARTNATMNEVRPLGWPSGEQAGPFTNWSTAKYLPDVGQYGAYVIYGSGHLTSGEALFAGVFVRPLDGVTGWQVRTEHAPILEGAGFGDFFASTQTGSVGWPYPGHQYTGLIVQPAANGGTPDWGSLYTVMLGGWGGSNARAVYRFDLANPPAAPTRVIDEMAIAGSGNSYPAAIEDPARGGWWTLNYNGNGPLIWTDWNTFAQTAYSEAVFNDEKDYQLSWAPELGVLVAAGGTNTGYHIRVNPVEGGQPGSWIDVPLDGTPPPNALAGIEWCPLLGKFAAYEGLVNAGAAVPAEAYVIHWLTPPADLVRGNWTWSHETLAGQGGAVIYSVINTNNNQLYATRPYSKFRWVPKLRSFVFGTGLSGPVQLWRPAGT